MPAPSLFDQLREQSRPSFEPEPLDTGRIVKDVDTRLAKESADYAKGQEQAAKDAAKQQVQGLREKGYTVVHDEAGNPAPLTAANGEPVRRKAGSRIHVGEQTGDFYEPDLQKGGLKPASGQKKTDKNGRIIEDFGGGLVKDHGEDPAWAKQKEDKTLLTKAEAAIRDKMLEPPPDNLDVVKVKKDYAAAQKALVKAENDLEKDKIDKDYLAAHAKAKAALDAISPQNEAINQWSKSKTGLHRRLAQIKTHRELLGEGAFTDEHRKQWQSVIAPLAAPQPATVTPPAPTAGASGQAALQASKEPMSESPTAAPATGTVATPTRTQAPSPAVSPVQGQGTVAPSVVSPVSSPQPITPAPREQLVTPESVTSLPIADHSSALQASSAALQQNAAALEQKRAQVMAPVAAVDAKLSAWKAKSQAALASGDSAISMMQPDGTMSPLFAASTKKELQDLYLERQKAQTAIAPQLEELDGEFAAHGKDVDAHNQVVESLKGELAAKKDEEEANRASLMKFLRSSPVSSPIADQLENLKGDFEKSVADIQSKNWDDATKEAAIASLKKANEPKYEEVQRKLEGALDPIKRISAEQDLAKESSKLKNEESIAIGKAGSDEEFKALKLKMQQRRSELGARYGVDPEQFDTIADTVKERPYSVENGQLQFLPKYNGEPTPEMLRKGIEAAVKDRVVNDDPTIRESLQKAEEEYKKLVAEAGGADKVKAALVGAGKAAAFMAGAELVGPMGAELGAKAGALAGPEGVPIGAAIGSIAAALLGGVASGAAYDKLREAAGGYFKAVNSFNQAAKLNPGVTQASELVSFLVMPEGVLKPSLFAKEGLKAGLTPAIAKSVQNYAKLADIAADAVGEAGASAAIDSARNVAKLKEVLKASGQSIGGAAAFTAGQYAFDAGRYALADLVGIEHEELHAPTLSHLATNVGLGLLLHGKSLAFKDYSAPEVASIITRMKVRQDAGISPGEKVEPAVILKAFKDAGVDLDKAGLAEMSRPLTTEEASVYEAAKAQTKKLQESGAFAGKGVEFGGARQAMIPKMFGKSEPMTTAVVHPKGEKPTDTEPQLPNPDVPPNLPGGLPPEVRTAASDAELKANPNGGDPEKATVLHDIATGADVAAMTEGELNAVGLTHKGDKVVPITGKDAPTPAVQVTGDGKAIILQPALDELRATFPATAEFVTMDEKQAREKFAQNGNTDEIPPEDEALNSISAMGVIHDLTSDEIGEGMDSDDVEMALENIKRKLAKGQKIDWAIETSLSQNIGTSGFYWLKKFAETPEGVDILLDAVRKRQASANGNTDTRPTEPVVENAAETTPAVAAEPRVEPTPSGEVAAKPVVPNPAAVAKVADIAATFGKQSATNIQEKLSPLHPKVTKVIDGMISAYGKRGVKIIKGKSDATSGIEYDALTKVITLDLPKIQANTEGSTPNDTIAWVRDSVARHELVHLISTTDKTVAGHLDELWSQLTPEDKSASAKTYYKGSRDQWDSDFRGKHEFMVQLVQAAEDGKLEPALLKILKGNSKSLFNTLRQLMDALIARLQRILTDPKHKAHEAAKKTLEAFKAARARLFAEPVGKVDTTSGLRDLGESEGDATTGLSRKTTNPAEGGQSKSGVGNRPAASNEAPDASSFASGVASKVADSGDVATVDVKAHEAAASPHNDLTPPTPAQIEADNYKVGKVRLAGEDISIETPAGAKRREEWPALKDHYGRILGTKGADGELLDIFIKEGTPLDWNGPVFVVNQNKPDGTFDETKAIAGAKSVAEAREIYKRNYSKGWKGLGGIVKYDSLKDWVESDHSGKATKKGNTQESDYEKYISRFQIADQENQKGLSPELRSDELYIKSLRPKYLINDPVVKGLLEKYKIQTGEKIGNFNASYILQKLIGAMNKAGVSKTTPSNKGVDVKPVNVKTGGMENQQQEQGLSPEAKAERIQMIRDMMKTNKENGKPIPQGWINKLAELEGSPKPQEGEIYSNIVAGHPQFDSGNSELQYLVPIKVSKIEDLDSKFDRAQSLLDKWNKEIGTLEYEAKNGKTPALRKKAAADLSKLGATKDARDLLRDETIPELERLRKELLSRSPAIITPPAPPQPKAEVVLPPPPQPHPANVDIPSDMATRKEIASLVKLKHRRSTEDESRLIELGKQHLKYVREVLNIERVDGLGDTDMMVGASLDKGESTNDKRHSASDQRILRALSQPESTPALIAEVKSTLDTLFELPPRKRSLSGMRDAVSKRLDVLERQQEDGNFPSDKSRGVRADDWKIVERDGKFIIQEKVTGEEDLGFPTYDTRAEAEAKVKAENDANTLDNRTTVDGEDKLRERINTLRALLGRIEAKMSGIKDTSEAQREEQRRALAAKPMPTKPRPMNMAGETRPVRTKTTAPAFDTLPTKSQEKFNAAFTSKDADGMNALLHPGNKGLRAEFERRTRSKLPAGVGTTKAAVETWAGPQESPLMKSWRALRAELPSDTVIAFRLGDFYEFFSTDAEFVAPVMNVALTKRNGIPMAGVPHHAATKYFQQLTQAGKKVAVVEATEDGKRAVVNTVEPEKPESPEKEPWQMTREEYRKQTQKTDEEIRLREPRHEAYTQEETDDLHRRELSDAIQKGKPVPAEVLADYPQLQPKEKAPELMTPSEEPPTSNEQPSNPPTPATTPAEGQSTGGVVEGEKAPTAQEWKALHEEHQALLKASKNDPQAWKPKEWQAHRADLMKREAESRKVPSIWTHNELVTTKGKYEIDHETGELTKLQDLSETGFIRNVDSMFKDGIPESGIDGGNNLAREMWDKVKAERAEAAQRKADAIAEAEAAAKVKAEEQVKLDAEQKAKFADYEASVPKVKFEPATLEVELMGGPTKLNGYRSGDWFIEIRLSKYNGPRVWYVPTKQKLPDSLALRNQTEAKDLVTKVANANKGFNGDFAKDEPQRLKILDTLKAWKDGVAPAWFTTTPAASPKETSPKKGDLATISLGGREYPKTRILNVVETPEGTRYQVDVFGPKFVSRADVVKVERQVAKVAAPVAATPQLIRQLGDIAVKNRQPVSEEYIDAVGGRIPEGYALKDGSYQAKEPETDKPPASSDVVKPPKLQSPSITPEQDAEYMKAADSGDTETAQRMVNEAAGPRIAKRAAILRNIASKSYPNVKLIGGNGDFGDDVESVFSESGVYVSGVREPLFAYVIDGEVVGGVMADTDGDFMFDLAVKERFRGRGIGRELISRTIKYFIKNRSRLAAEQGLETSSYDMIGLPTNAAARSLNLSVGMEHSREESSITGEFLDSIDPVTRDESGNVIPLSQRFTPSNDIRFSLAPRSQQDTEYLAAVEAGDTETAQRMVNEAARGAALGGALPVDLAQGIYLHWDGENRVTVVQKDRRGVDEIGMFEGYLPKTDDRPAHFLMFALNPNKQGRGIGPLAIKALANMGELMVDSTERDMRSSLSKIDAKQTGEDEFKIKSADPITRRPDGSIIPLSERFNPASPTPLQTQSPDSDEYWSYNTVVKWMTDNGIPVDMTREEYEGEVARRKGIIEPPVHDTTQAGTAQMREQGGYEEYIKNEPRSFREKVWPEALQIVSKEPFKGTELVKELLDSPRALEDTERAILTHESLRRQKAYDKSIDDLIAAKPEDYAAAEKKMMAAREAHQEGLEALDMAGSKAGSALGAIRLMIKNDFSLGRLERRFRAALGPKPTPEEIKEADAKAAELAKVIKENDELTEQIRSQLDEIAGLKAAMKAHEHGLTPKADRKAEIKEEDEALARLKARRKLGAPGVGSAPMFQATREPFDGTTRVPSYFATSEDYAKNFGEHIRPVAIYPKNTLDLTDIEGSDEEGGKKLKTALQAKGISIDGLNISSDDELPQALMRNLKELSLRIKAAGFDTVRISEYTLNGGADQTVLVVDKSALSSSDVLASPSPEDDDFNNLVIFGRRFIRDGAPDLASFTTAFNEALPGALGDNASAVYEAAKVKFKEAEDAALKDSTPTGVTNKIKGKRAEITDLKADDLNRLALSIVQHEGVKDVDTLRSRMHEHLEEIFPHITERDVSKAWTGFEKAIYPSEDPFRKTVSDLRAQEQLILKAQTLLEEERLALKSGRQPPPRTDAQRKLIRDYNELVKASGLTTSDPVTQLASTQSRIVKALENRKADLEAQVAAKKREVRANVTTEETPEMKRLRKEIAALNAKLDILDPRNTGPTEAQKIKISENALKKSIENVDKEIAELERKVKNNDLSESVPATKTPVTSPTIAQRRKELAAKREQRDELANQLDDLREAAKPVVDPVMKVLGKWEERQNLATVKAPPRTKSRLEELSKRYLDSESPRFVQDAVALGMSLGDAEYAKLILDAERNRREEIALASMRRRVRRNIERQVARAQAFDEDSPLARKTPAEKKLDKDLTEAEFQLSLAKREALRAEEKFRLRNRTPLRKAADFAVKWRRALILADYVVLYKLGMAAGWRMAFTPTEEVIGAGISKAIPGLSKNAPREFGGSVRAEAEALTQGFRYFVENFGKVLKHGVSSMDTKYSSKPDFNDLDPSLSDYIGNSHAAIKLLPKASEFYRSFRKRTEAALRNGIDATSPAAVQAIGAAAYLDAQRAIFMNPNFVSEGWRAIIGKLRKTETSPNWAKATADVMEAAIPIVKVPTNILFEALGSYIGGILRETPFALKSAAKAATTFDGQGFAKRFNDEYSKLPPEQAEAVLRHLKKGAFGNALMLLVMLTGATAAKLIGGLWTPDDKREPWQVKPERLRLTEDSKDLPRWIAHNPVFDTLHFAVTAYHYAEKAANASKAIAAKAEVEIAEAEHRMKKANGSSKDFIKAQQEREVARKKLEVARSAGDPNKLAWAMATLSGMTTSTLALVEKAPLIGNVGQFLDAIPEDKKGDYLKKELAASAIPTGVTNIAKGEDEGADGEPIKRKMESFSDHLKNRIPGLRQTLPFKNGETDEFGFKRSETHVPIPGEKAIENFNKKNPDVKYHIPKISQASLDDLPNEVAKTAFQIRAGELLRKYSKEGIVKSEVVNDGSRKEPNFVIKKTVEIPPITKEESENPTLKTIEKLKSMHRKAVTTAKSDAERPDWPLSYLDKYRSSVTK